jgi:ABC-type transport system involved in cytochrome c biogenesis permease subunit
VSNDQQITYAVVILAGLVSVVAWVVLILMPAWASYWRLREKLLAAVMSVYILAAFVVMGAVIGGVFLYYYDRL